MDVPGFALITGAASGIGRACAKAFLQEGSAGIALLDLNEGALKQVHEELTALLSPQTKEDQTTGFLSNGTYQSSKPNCRIHIFPCDVSNEEQVTNAVKTAASTFGRLDYVINAAGIAMKHIGGTAFAKTEDWKRILDINLNGSFYVVRATAAIMLEQKPLISRSSGQGTRGSIVNFSSIQGVVGISLSGAYTASKHAIIGLTRSTSEDYAGKGIRVNAILPGYTETPLTMGNEGVRKAMEERVGTAVPMLRAGRPEEIADGVLYLAGGRSSFVTGSCLSVDGGYTSR